MLPRGTFLKIFSFDLVLEWNYSQLTFLFYFVCLLTAARLAQWDKRRPSEGEAEGSNPSRTNTQGL